jgi:hypothetical protein
MATPSGFFRFTEMDRLPLRAGDEHSDDDLRSGGVRWGAGAHRLSVSTVKSLILSTRITLAPKSALVSAATCEDQGRTSKDHASKGRRSKAGHLDYADAA